MTQNIRGKYIAVINAIEEEHGSNNCDYVVPKNATLAECIGYARKYYVEGQEKHHRYNRCWSLLETAMDSIPLDTSSKKTLLHIDVGAGPGLYTWVLRDYARQHYRTINLELYGYDRVPGMAKLANMMWGRFDENVSYSCFHDKNELCTAAAADPSRSINVVLTLGYVLIQTDGDGSLNELASLCETFSVNSNVCLIAIDAYSWDRPTQFESAWNKLVSLLSNRRVSVEYEDSSQKVAQIYMTSSLRGRK